MTTLFKELDKRVEDGHLRKVISPCRKLVLFNYTDACTYDKAWDEHTLNARGTVYEIETGNIIAQAFPKFFNYGELDLDLQKDLLHRKDFDVYEKADGSLGIIYHFDGEWRVNTRGSFSSDQSVFASSMLGNYDLSGFPKDITLLVEIIYPENRIIVDYGDDKKLILLGAFQNVIDLNSELFDIGSRIKMEVAQKKSFSSIDELIKEREVIPAGEEGFVVRFSDGERVKFKGMEYLKVARILQGCSPLTFWESMVEGNVDRTILEQIPEEFRDEFDRIAQVIEHKYSVQKQQYTALYFDITRKLALPLVHDQVNEEHRKKLGIYLKENNIKESGVIFTLLLGQSIDKQVMRAIRPTANVL